MSKHLPQGDFRAGSRWKKLRCEQDAESFLRENELLYVAASNRFLKQNPAKDKVWALRETTGGICALLVYAGRNLLPVFCGQKKIPEPRFLNGIFGVPPLNSAQGLKTEVQLLENFLAKLGLHPVEKIDYDLMAIDISPNAGGFSGGPAKLVLRLPRPSDLDTLAVLQAGYEREEVLPAGSVFNPAASRLNTEKIFSSEQMLIAELDGSPVGKINTSALSFTRFQIGGVYVRPDFRGRGIARRMTAEFVRALIAQGRGVNLFVKKSNAAALAVYRRLGFNFLSDYRISYF